MTTNRWLDSLKHAPGKLLPILAAAFSIIIRLTSGSFPIDDAYITFRYAQNAASGLGMVYNAGESIFGTSTPLYAILLAGLAKFLGQSGIPIYALWINAVTDGLTTFLIFHIALYTRLPSWMAMIVALLQAIAPMSIRYAIGGMESSLVTALTLAAVCAHIERHEDICFHLVGLAILTRPDALAIGASLVISSTIDARRIPWKSIGILGGWIILGMSILEIFYRLPIPHSIIAKSAPIYYVTPWTNFLQFVYHFGGLLAGNPVNLTAKGIIISPTANLNKVIWIFFIPQAALWIIGAVRCLRIDRRMAAFVAYPLIFASTYSILGLRGSLIAEWYLVSLIPFYILPLSWGIITVLKRFTPHAFPLSGQTIAILMLVSELTGLNLGRNINRGLWVPIGVWNEREELYQQAAAFLEPQTSDQTVVAAPEIGALGYHCKCSILDTVGLVSPQALQYYPLPYGDQIAVNIVPSQLIRDEEPDFIVSLERFIRDSLMIDEWFKSHYHLVWQKETSIFSSNGLLIYQRNQ